MDKIKSEEMDAIFRRFSPVNQRYLLMMAHIADVAEKNAVKKNRTQKEPEQGNLEA